jgi:hypothetical protein
MILLRSFLSGHIRIKRTLEYYDAGIGPRVPFGGGGGAVSPIVSSIFASELGDYTTLSTTSSMPTGGSITRAGNAMLYDSTGKLTYAPNNLLLQSNNFSSASQWSLYNATFTASGITDPFGGTTAVTMTLPGGVAGHLAFAPGTTPALTSNDKRIFAIWVKASASGGAANIRLSTNNVSSWNTGVSSKFTLTSSWQLAYVAGQLITSGTQLNISVGSYDASAGFDTTCVGNVDIAFATYSAVTYETTPRSGDQVITTTSAYYGPRFDYDPATLAAKGLLVEGTRTNLVSGAWDGTSGYTVSPNTSDTVGPDGTNNATKLTENNANSNHYSRPSFLPTSSGVAYSYSAYFKKGTTTIVQIAAQGSASLDIWANFDINSGVIGSIGTSTTAAITNVGNGWYRCSVAGVSSGASSFGSVFISGTDNNLSSARFPSYAGSTSNYFYAYGAQLEEGAFPTSYIPTPSASVARAAETFTLANYQNRLVESFYIDEGTGGSWSANINASATSPLTISTPTFGWVTSLRPYTNAYAGDITTPSWIDNSGTTGNRMYYDSTGALTWAPANLLTQSNTFSNADWQFGVTPVVVSTNNSDPFGGTTATLGTIAAAPQYFRHTNVSSLTQGLTILVSIWAKQAPSSSATNIRLTTNDGISWGTGFSTKVALTSSWQRISGVFTVGSSGILRVVVGALDVNGSEDTSCYGNVLVYGGMAEPVTYQTSPRAYIPTTSAAVYQPRYDYAPSVTPATPRGMLIEESRTNLVFPSVPANTSWNPFASTLSSVSGMSPAGTTTIAQFTPSTGLTNQVCAKTTIAISASTAYTFSCYVKANGYNFGSLSIYTGDFISILANLTTGAITNSGSSPSSTYVGSTATSVGNGWWRLTLMVTSGAGVTSANVYCGSYPANTFGSGTGLPTQYVGDGVSGAYFWGAQLEAGSFATSYIPTTSASVTRVADVVKLTGSPITVLTAATGSLAAEFDTVRLSDGTRIIGSVSPTPMQVYSGSLNWYNVAANAAYPGATVSAGVVMRGAIGWTNNANISYVANGGTVGTNATTSGIGSPYTNAWVGSDAGTQFFLNGRIRSLAFYNQRLSDTTLKAKSIVGSSL